MAVAFVAGKAEHAQRPNTEPETPARAREPEAHEEAKRAKRAPNAPASPVPSSEDANPPEPADMLSPDAA